jgi:hypothetical protein
MAGPKPQCIGNREATVDLQQRSSNYLEREQFQVISNKESAVDW